MKKKIALIFGVTGQDGAYLSRFLLSKKYVVHGVIRKSSSFNTGRIDDIYKDPHEKRNFFLHYGDVLDSLSILKILKDIKPNEIYNLAAQSHVRVSFDVPEFTANTVGLGALRILDAIKTLKLNTKYYQAGSSEMFGASPPPQNEKTKFYPRSPYAVAKVFAHMITVNYREAYNIFACNGILFNHESPLRGETFVTKKVVKALYDIKLKNKGILYLGNLYAKRDWGHAKDYVEAMWKMLQIKKPGDYVISSNKSYSVKYFVNLVAKKLNMKIKWRGKGLNEVALYKNKEIIKIDSRYFRPTEVENLRGSSSYASKKLRWKPKHNLSQLVDDMLRYEAK